MIVTFPIPRVDRHEPFHALAVLVVVLAGVALVALAR